MFNTIVLLTGPTEYPVLANELLQHNPHLSVRHVASLGDLTALTRAELRRARLIGFVTPVIVPARVLNTLGFGAYNFHPGPPHYPGWMPAHFAIYDRATSFGVTAHLMAERVDCGPIVGVEYFDIERNTTPVDLEQRTYGELARLFWRLSHPLATQSRPLIELPIKWSGRKSTHHGIVAACAIPLDIDRVELERRLAAFGEGVNGHRPTITLHGHRFAYEPPQADAPEEADPEARKTSVA